MQLNLGIKIRELRYRDHRTQENLAEALGVTAQAVSRWESGGSYPDMEIIPAIANYFHVSIDELFGYHQDREEKIQSIVNAAIQALRRQGSTMGKGMLSEEVAECVAMLRASLEEFPNEPRILYQLGFALLMQGWHEYGTRVASYDAAVLEEDVEYNQKNEHWQEAILVYERLLHAELPSNQHNDVIFQLTTLYHRMGKYDKAKALADAQNQMFTCREMLLPQATVGEEMLAARGRCIAELLSHLYGEMSRAFFHDSALRQAEYSKNTLAALLNLMETAFCDGRFGRWHWSMALAYQHMAQFVLLGSGDKEEMRTYLEKGLEHSIAYNRLCHGEEYHMSAPLFSRIEKKKGECPVPIDSRFWVPHLQGFPPCVVDALKGNPAYADFFA